MGGGGVGGGGVGSILRFQPVIFDTGDCCVKSIERDCVLQRAMNHSLRPRYERERKKVQRKRVAGSLLAGTRRCFMLLLRPRYGVAGPLLS